MRVTPGDGDVVEEDVAVRVAPDRQALALESVRLPRSAAAEPHDHADLRGPEVGQRRGDVLDRLPG